MVAGTPPSIIGVDPTGTVSGTPTETGSYGFTVQASDASGQQVKSSASIAITGLLAITTTSLPGGKAGVPYSANVAASGGLAPYSWNLTGGVLPPGLILSTPGGISGTPTTAGSFTFTLQVSDSGGGSSSQTYAVSMAVATVPLSITTTSLPNGTVGTAYSSSVSATGGTSPYAWAVSAGALPAGLTLSSGGGISGTPTAAGSSTFILKVTDSTGATSSQTYAVSVAAPAVVITTTSLPNGTTGTAYSSSVSATGGTSPYTWSVSAGALPAGLALSSGGGISGTPTAAGSSTFTLKVTDSIGGTNSQSFTVSIVAGVIITSTSLPNGTTGVAYNVMLAATGGTAPYSWSLASGLLPTGVGLSTTTGMISGTPTTIGSYNVTVKVTDAARVVASASFVFAVAASLTITTTSLPSGTVGVAYNTTLAPTGGTAPYSWTVASGQLPPGLALGTSGSITGTPSSAGSYTFTAQVTDSASPQSTASETLSINVNITTQVTDDFDRPSLGPNWTTAFGTIILVNNAYTSNQPNYPQDSAAFWNANSFTANHYSQATLNLPDNTSYAGVLVRGGVNSGYFCYGANQFLFLQKRVAGVQTTLASTNSYVFQSGDVMRLDVYGTTLRCLINGVVKLTATDSDLSSGSPGISGLYATQTTTGDNWTAGDWTGGPVTITPTVLPNPLINSPYSQPLIAANGAPPYTWAVMAGTLPTGLALNSSTGLLSGTPTTLGTFAFTMLVADSSFPQKSATIDFSIVVSTSDIYGGDTTVKGTTTGNWHPELISGRWWLVDPLGNAAHFVAPYNVGHGDGIALNGSTMAARVNTKYGTDNNNWTCAYLPAVVGRLNAWGLTGIGGGSDIGMMPFQQSACWGLDSGLGGYYMPQQYRKPVVLYFQTSSYAMTNTPQTYPVPADSPLDQPVKNLNYGLNSYLGYGGYIPGGGEPDVSDTRLSTYFDYLIPSGGSSALYFSAPPEIQSYVWGAFIDEADQMYSFTTGGRNPSFSTGWDHSHGGLRVLRTSPLQYANRSKSAIYPDGKVYVKAVALRSYLKSAYGTIAALNTAWGSSYSACDMEGAGDEFGSCGKLIQNESYAVSDGMSSTYTHTLAQSVPSWRSLAVYVNGAMVAGDLAYNAGDADIYAAPNSPPASASKFCGPLIDASSSSGNFINYTAATGTARTTGITFKTGSARSAKIFGNGSTVTVKTQSQHGSWPGAHVTITGSSNYNVAGALIASVLDSYTFTISAANTGPVEIDAGTISFTDAAPPKGAAITISYVANGWGIGNGLMDEDGRHSNCLGANNDNRNAVQLNLCMGGSYANPQIATDLDGVLGRMATDYFSKMNTVFGNHFGNATARKVLNLGPDPLIYSVSPGAPGVLQAAGQYTDIIGIASYTADGANFYEMTQAKLDYIRQYYGDKPLLNADFIMGQPDSALRGSPATTGAQNFSTQAARGAAYLNLMQLITSLAYTNGGSKPYIGTQFWQWTDSLGEGLNWGLVTPYDNAYDGHEDTTATTTCSAPTQALSCGGEQYNSGDFITAVKAADALWH